MRWSKSNKTMLLTAVVAGGLLSAIVIGSHTARAEESKKNTKAEESKANTRAEEPKNNTRVEESKKKTKLRENSYYYSAFNRRDPFQSLIVGDFVSDKKMSPVDVGRVELVGVVKGDLDRFALLEDEKGFSYILRVGDRVRNGSVVAIGDRSMVARVTNFGQTRKFTLHLARAEGDQK